MTKKSSKTHQARIASSHRARTEAGQGLSITTIIVAAIGLIVLVVLVAIFTGQIGKFNIGVEREKTGTTCQDASPKGFGAVWSATPCTPGKDRFPSNPDDVRMHPDQHCCIP